MASGRWDSVIHEIRRMASLGDAVNLPDQKLLEAFTAKRDQVAFEVLVRRYGPMVFGVCKRILRHAQDAEDAFQATFLVLVRKAASLGPGAAVGNWLYSVAYRTALHARDRSARHRRKEAEVPPMNLQESAQESAGQAEMQALLDRELSRLPDKYRAPVVLCDLLGKTKRQAAEELRCPEGTVSSRLARGREMLRKRLGYHESIIGGAAGAVLFEQSATAAVPWHLYGATVKAAATLAKGTAVAGSIAPSVAALVQGVMKAMFISKLKPLVAFFLAVSLLAGAAYVVHSSVGDGEVENAQKKKDKGKQGQLPPPDLGKLPAKKEAPAIGETAQKKERLRYDGKTFLDWSDMLLTELKPSVRVEAITAIGAFGMNGYADKATLCILDAMKMYDLKTADGATGQMVKKAQEVLAQIGPKVLPELTKVLKSDKVNDRRFVMGALKAMRHPHSEEALPFLIVGMKDEDRGVRNSALEAIYYNSSFRGSITAAEKAELALTIAKAMDDDQYPVRLMAAEVLGRLGTDAKPAAAALVKTLRYKDEDLRVHVLKALNEIGPAAADVIPMLMKMINEDKDVSTRKCAVYVLKGMGPAAKDAVPSLINVLQLERDEELRFAAVTTLGAIGPAAKEAVPTIIDGFKGDFSIQLQDKAIETLGLIGPDAAKAVPTLIAGLITGAQVKQGAGKKGSPRLLLNGKRRIPAIEALGKIGPAAKEAVPVLIAEFAGVNPLQRSQFILPTFSALGEIGPAAKEAIPALLTFLKGVPPEPTPAWATLRDGANDALEKIRK